MSVFLQTQYAPIGAAEAFSNNDPTRSMIVDKCVARNNGAVAARLSLYLVPPGGAPDASNMLYDETLSANDVALCDEIVGFDLGPNDALWWVASVASTIVMRVTGRLR